LIPRLVTDDDFIGSSWVIERPAVREDIGVAGLDATRADELPSPDYPAHTGSSGGGAEVARTDSARPRNLLCHVAMGSESRANISRNSCGELRVE
jgi:hypothetical protein